MTFTYIRFKDDKKTIYAVANDGSGLTYINNLDGEPWAKTKPRAGFYDAIPEPKCGPPIVLKNEERKRCETCGGYHREDPNFHATPSELKEQLAAKDAEITQWRGLCGRLVSEASLRVVNDVIQHDASGLHAIIEEIEDALEA